jgi:hypothetical protein
MGLLNFYRTAVEYAEPDSAALEQAGESGAIHAAYHRRIVQVSCWFGVIGTVLGVVLALVMVGQARSGKDLKGVLLAPFVFGAAGLLFGTALACLFAPRAFLTGPLGAKWMKLIGTDNVVVARLACAAFGLVVMAPFVLLGLAIAFCG